MEEKKARFCEENEEPTVIYLLINSEKRAAFSRIFYNNEKHKSSLKDQSQIIQDLYQHTCQKLREIDKEVTDISNSFPENTQPQTATFVTDLLFAPTENEFFSFSLSLIKKGQQEQSSPKPIIFNPTKLIEIAQQIPFIEKATTDKNEYKKSIQIISGGNFAWKMYEKAHQELINAIRQDHPEKTRSLLDSLPTAKKKE